MRGGSLFVACVAGAQSSSAFGRAHRNARATESTLQRGAAKDALTRTTKRERYGAFVEACDTPVSSRDRKRRCCRGDPTANTSRSFRTRNLASNPARAQRENTPVAATRASRHARETTSSSRISARIAQSFLCVAVHFHHAAERDDDGGAHAAGARRSRRIKRSIIGWHPPQQVPAPHAAPTASTVSAPS